MGLDHIIGPVAGIATSQTVNHLEELLNTPDDEVTVDQLVAIGIFKSQGHLWPEVGSNFTDVATAYVEDFEALRHEGISSSKALKIIQFIYIPRFYLIDGDYLSEDFVRDLDDETIEHIVDNALLKFLETKGLNPGENFNYFVAGIEQSEFFEQYNQEADRDDLSR